jgi:hypothetical protein
MSTGLWTNVSGVNRKIKKLYANVGGVNRPIKELWAVKDGVNRKIFSAYDCQGHSITGTIYADGHVQSGQERKSTNSQYSVCKLIFSDPVTYTKGEEFALFSLITSYFAYTTQVYLYDADAGVYVCESQIGAFSDRSGYTISSLSLAATVTGNCQTIILVHRLLNSQEDAGYFTIDKMKIGGITINSVELI